MRGSSAPGPFRRPFRAHLDLASLEVLYDCHCRQTLGLAYTILGDLAEAEAVVQEVLLAAWRRLAGDVPETDITRTWLLMATRCRSIEMLRQRGAGAVGSAAWPAPADMAGVAGQPTLKVDTDVARRALAELPSDQRQVIQLAYFEGLTQVEIAKQLGVHQETIKARLRLALDRLGTDLGVVPSL